jgi:membrane-bound inhibitor of C-type lysozyme
MKMNLASGLLLSLTLVSANSALASISVRYTCKDGTKFSAVFQNSGTGQVTLSFLGGAASLTLLQALSADGGRYTDGATQFWIKGRSATFTRNGTETSCSQR